MKRAAWYALCLIWIFALTSAEVLAQVSTAPACSAAENKQFDFWIGDWDVTEAATGAHAAQVRVERILDGCVLLEQYQDPGGLKGHSFTIYDASRQVWHQSWVTNRGQLLTLEGRLNEGRLNEDGMVLSGKFLSPDHKENLVRGTWKPESAGVRETAVTSTDGGKTWKIWFDLMFRKKGAAKDGDDAATVAALDTEYQAAVKANDAVTMERILADDFVLVLGSGKSFNKTELLDSARTRLAIYEHQEDTEQKVRVYGNTAVVTAKLYLKGTQGGKPFERTLWFSDTYVRTASGWRYVFGQASLPLPSN
jgi:ketosteroid isomerase-like protein